ncbi:hypothetical protein BBJ28_00016287 [Nothophytophthora sp. Chile5]|nr:hypothetical protein BBJ28_00016287 [Nothophytophthora sp. Chile5]
MSVTSVANHYLNHESEGYTRSRCYCQPAASPHTKDEIKKAAETMARSRSASRSPSRSTRHGASSSRSSRHDRDRHGSSSRRRDRSRSREPSGRSRRRDSDVDASASSAKAKTEDKNGEVSMSVEETNRLRAQLGLKPLSVGPSKSEAAVVNRQKTSEQLDAEREREQLKRKLEQSRTRRELTQKLAGQSLGEQLRADLQSQKKAEKTHDALEWVKKSRRQGSNTSKRDGLNTKEASAEAYEGKQLAGLTVGHALDTFAEGQEVVLTLKDSRVLGEDGNALNEADDELVNVELSEKDRRLAQQARARRAAMPVYSGYDDDEFIEMGKTSRKMRKTGKLLGHYDEEQDARDTEGARKFRLDASGGSTALQEAANQQNDDEGDVAVVSLAMDRSRAVEDYYTKEEVAAQFAKRKKGKKLRKKKKTRRHHDEDLGENDEEVEVQLNSRDPAEEAGDAGSLVAQLEKEAMQEAASASRDRGKRKRRSRDEDEDPEEEEKLLRFQEAREKANAKASEALAASSSGKKRMKRRPVDDSEIVDDAAAVEMELGASLARARQLAQQQAQTHSLMTGPTTSEARIAQLVNQTMSHEPATTENGASNGADKPTGQVFGQTFGDLEATTNTVVFNEATDFETRLRDAMEKRAAQFQAATAPSNSISTIPAVAKTQQVADNQEQKLEVEETKADDKEDEESKENEVWGEEEPLVGTGVGATLALLRKTGDLRQTRVERQAGRANDARERNPESDLRIKDGVTLDYRDEFGRLLTKKEAFRLLSYKFHGLEPGKKKKEKRLKQLKEELAAQKLLSGEGSTKMMKVLEKKQKHTKEAHVVLSSGV